MLRGMRLLLASLALVLLGLTAKSGEPARAAATIDDPKALADFENQVRPLLAARCVKCHGPRKQESNLRLDSRAAMMQGGDSGPAIVPGTARAEPVREGDPARGGHSDAPRLQAQGRADRDLDAMGCPRRHPGPMMPRGASIRRGASPRRIERSGPSSRSGHDRPPRSRIATGSARRSIDGSWRDSRRRGCTRSGRRTGGP